MRNSLVTERDWWIYRFVFLSLHFFSFYALIRFFFFAFFLPFFSLAFSSSRIASTFSIFFHFSLRSYLFSLVHRISLGFRNFFSAPFLFFSFFLFFVSLILLRVDHSPKFEICKRCSLRTRRFEDSRVLYGFIERVHSFPGRRREPRYGRHFVACRTEPAAILSSRWPPLLGDVVADRKGILYLRLVIALRMLTFLSERFEIARSSSAIRATRSTIVVTIVDLAAWRHWERSKLVTSLADRQ